MGTTREYVLADASKIGFNHGYRLYYCKEKRVKIVKCYTAITFTVGLVYFILFCSDQS